MLPWLALSAAFADPMDAAQASAVANEIVVVLGQVRSLPVSGPLAVEVMTPAELRDVVHASMYDHMTREQSDVLTRTAVGLGVVPPGTDGETLILDVLEQAMLGLYDTRGKRLIVSLGADPELLPMVIGHESAHALQDMSFGLERMRVPMFGHSDAETARTWLIEGDAQATWMVTLAGGGTPGAAMREAGDAMLADRSNGALAVMLRGIQMPYTEGTATILELAEREGWGAVDALYDHLPDSTEQMLHVEKLIAREAPIAVQADAERLAEALPAWQILWEDEVGEAGVLASAAEVVPVPEARACAAGWGGDRFVAFDQPGADVPITVGRSVWDSEEDARQFVSCWGLFLEDRFPGRWVIERRGDEAVFVSGIEERAAGRLLRKGWKTFRPAG